jgi:hypothetical protein
MTETFIKYPEMKTLFKLIPSDEKGKKWDATSGEILPETAALHFTPWMNWFLQKRLMVQT